MGICFGQEVGPSSRKMLQVRHLDLRGESAGGGWNEGRVAAVPKGRASAPTPGVVSLGDGGTNGAGVSTFVAVDVETLPWVDMRGSSWHPRG